MHYIISSSASKDETEWMAYCVAILSNLVSRSNFVTNKLKKMVFLHFLKIGLGWVNLMRLS